MKKFSLILGVFSIAMLFVSCDKEDKNSIDTSKAIRGGNFLQAANFEDVSRLNIKNSDQFVTEKIENGIASFKYSIPEGKSLRSVTDYREQTTEIKLNEPVLAEFEEGEYILEFSYLFQLDDPDEIHSAKQNINMLLRFEEINVIDDDVIPISEPREFKLGSGGDVPMNNEWSTYRITMNIRTSVVAWMDKHPNVYANISFELRNVSKINNNTFFVKDIRLVKK